MSMLSELNKIYRVDASNNASDERDIADLIAFSPFEVPSEYLELIQERTEVEINVQNQGYIRIWGAKGCIEMNEAYFIQKYIPYSLAIGDDEGGNAILYAEGQNGFGIYAVGFGDLDADDMVFIAKSLRDLLILANGIEILMDL